MSKGAYKDEGNMTQRVIEIKIKKCRLDNGDDCQFAEFNGAGLEYWCSLYVEKIDNIKRKPPFCKAQRVIVEERE